LNPENSSHNHLEKYNHIFITFSLITIITRMTTEPNETNILDDWKKLRNLIE